MRARQLPARVILCLVWTLPGTATAQGSGEAPAHERLLRQAATLEAAGDLQGAEALVQALLEEAPGSVSGLLSLERLLRMQGREAELLPAARAFLDEDPDSPFGRHLLLRTFSALDSVAALSASADEWIRIAGDTETPYREAARVWQERGELERAREVLERGRRRVDRGDALAMELASVHARLGEVERAVAEFDRAIGAEARGLMLVRRQLSELPDGGARVVAPLVRRLSEDPTTAARRRAAAELAVGAGLAEPAREAAQRTLVSLPPGERQGFLVEMARLADGAGLHAVAFWAYQGLLDLERPGARALAIRSRLAALALALGDTAAARENYLALERSYAEGSPERRQAAALRIELTGREGDLEGATAGLERFRSEHPEAPELDALSATVAELLLRAGDTLRAAAAVERVKGPRSSLARGRLALRAGRLDLARAELMNAAPGLSGPEATETIGLLTLVGRLSPAGGRLVAEAMGELAEERADRAVERLASSSGQLPPGESAAVLDYAAGIADRAGLPGEAEAVRRLLLRDHPRAPEAPAALLALARLLASRPEGMLEARELLERLVLDHPRSALVPQARRELDRLAERMPSS